MSDENESLKPFNTEDPSSLKLDRDDIALGLAAFSTGAALTIGSGIPLQKLVPYGEGLTVFGNMFIELFSQYSIEDQAIMAAVAFKVALEAWECVASESKNDFISQKTKQGRDRFATALYTGGLGSFLAIGGIALFSEHPMSIQDKLAYSAFMGALTFSIIHGFEHFFLKES